MRGGPEWSAGGRVVRNLQLLTHVRNPHLGEVKVSDSEEIHRASYGYVLTVFRILLGREESYRPTRMRQLSRESYSHSYKRRNRHRLSLRCVST